LRVDFTYDECSPAVALEITGIHAEQDRQLWGEITSVWAGAHSLGEGAGRLELLEGRVRYGDRFGHVG
jgi:hypothetical protein